jgi:D-3-phosphoglycerate dehydrogenase
VLKNEPVRTLLLENIHPDAVARLKSEGHQVETVSRALDEDELIKRLDGVHLLGIRSKTTVSAAALAAAPELRAIGAFCIGTEQIDLGAAARSGIAVFNAPFSNTRSVVELALAEIIALTRRLTEKNSGMHAGVWDKAAEGSHEVRGRTLGIVGYGNIGTQLSVLAENLGMRVVFYDTADKLALGNAYRCGTLDDLLEVSDIVTLHVDGRAGNSGFFGEDQFARMRAGSLFNVILTPHIGGSTEEAQADIGSFVAEKLRHYVVEGGTTLSVNLPSLALPLQAGTHRLALVHHNVPGVLAEVNSILAAHTVNIEAQLLGTRGEVGYLLTDIGRDYPEEVLTKLRGMSQAIRLRVLPWLT